MYLYTVYSTPSLPSVNIFNRSVSNNYVARRKTLATRGIYLQYYNIKLSSVGYVFLEPTQRRDNSTIAQSFQGGAISFITIK